MSETSKNQNDLPEIDSATQARAALLDAQEGQGKFLRESGDDGLSLLDKAVEIGLEDREEIRQRMNAIGKGRVEFPEDAEGARSRYDEFYDAGARLSRAVLGQVVAKNDAGEERRIPAVVLERRVDTSQRLGTVPPASISPDALLPVAAPDHEVIPMARLVGDNVLVPRGDFTDEDVEAATGQLEMLDEAQRQGVLPHLSRDMLHINDNKTGPFVSLPEGMQDQHARRDPYGYDRYAGGSNPFARRNS